MGQEGIEALQLSEMADDRLEMGSKPKKKGSTHPPGVSNPQ